MDVKCDKCGTEYEFDDARIGARGVTVKCTACGFVFKVHKAEDKKGREWLVRRASGQVIAFRQLTTLQKWIIEGRISRDDEISQNGETWKRLGNIAELDPFFTVFDKAQALNELMTTGSIGERPIMVNGSEILATMSPLAPVPSQPFEGEPHQLFVSGPISDPGIDPAVDVAQSSAAAPNVPHRSTLPVRSSSRARPPSVSARNRTTEPAPPPDPRPPSAKERSPILAPGAPTHRAIVPPSELLLESSTAPDLYKIEAPPGASSAPDSRGKSNGTPAHSTPPVTPEPTIGEGGRASAGSPSSPALPATARAKPSPARPKKRDSLGIGEIEKPSGYVLDEGHDSSGDRVVDAFAKQQKTRRVLLVALGLIALGAAGGAGLVVYGPEGNPVRELAARFDLLPARPAPTNPGLEIAKQAREQLRLDTLDSLARADSLFLQVEQLIPDDATILADHALTLTTRADALRRSAARDEQRIATVDKERRDYEYAVGEQKALARRKGIEPRLPPEPAAVDFAALRLAAESKHAEASRLAKEAFALARRAYERAPDTIGPSRALADYYRVQRDPDGHAKKHLEVVRRATAATGIKDDPVSLYIEAAYTAASPSPPPSELAEATAKLETALTLDPKLIRARVQLARLLILREMKDLARAELERVVADVPDHSEAAILLQSLRPASTAPPAEPLAGAEAPPGPPPTAPAAPSVTEPLAAPEAPAAVAAGPKEEPANIPVRDPPPAEARPGPASPAASKPPRAEVDESSGEPGSPQPIKPISEKKSYTELMKEADRLRQKGDSQAALRAYERAGDLRLNSAQAFAGMGWCYLDQGKAVAAVHVFGRAVKINDGFAEGHMGRAEAARKAGMTQEAIDSYRRYLELKPDGAESRVAKKALEQLGAAP